MKISEIIINSPSISEDIKNKVTKAIEKIKLEMTENPEMECLNIAYKTEDLKEIKEFAENIRKNFKHTLIMGIGGSSLGAKTLTSLVPNAPITILESVDSEYVKQVFQSLDLKDTAFLTISKSGKTIECISQTLILMKMFEEKFGKEQIKNNFFFLTEDKDSPITNLAKELGIKTMEHHKTIGGRFSYLSNVGLIAGAIAGIDIEKIRIGAQNMIENIESIKASCEMQCQCFANGIFESVVMPYVENLKFVTEWYRQLCGESLGKKGFGITPINAMGTSDQHSQLQLYLDGPKNKFYTFIIREKSKNSLRITNSFNKGFDYLKNISLDDINEIEATSTINVMENRNLPIRVWRFNSYNEETLSEILSRYILETIVISKVNNINAFGQGAVEERKLVAKSMFEELSNN